jgi:hypothetical protein
MQEILPNNSSSSPSWTLCLLILYSIIPSSFQEMTSMVMISTKAASSFASEPTTITARATTSPLCVNGSYQNHLHDTSIINDTESAYNVVPEHRGRPHPESQPKQALRTPPVDCNDDLFSMEMKLLCHYYSQY